MRVDNAVITFWQTAYSSSVALRTEALRGPGTDPRGPQEQSTWHAQTIVRSSYSDVTLRQTRSLCGAEGILTHSIAA